MGSGASDWQDSGDIGKTSQAFWILVKLDDVPVLHFTESQVHELSCMNVVMKWKGRSRAAECPRRLFEMTGRDGERFSFRL